jgi:hypothetical protein
LCTVLFHLLTGFAHAFVQIARYNRPAGSKDKNEVWTASKVGLPAGLAACTNGMRCEGSQQMLDWHVEWRFPAADVGASGL